MPSSSKAAAAASSSSDGTMSAREVYEVTGDASAALRLLTTTADGPSSRYNQALLQAMLSPQDQTLNDLTSLEDSIVLVLSQSSAASRKRRRDEWTLTYNRSLLWLAQGQAEKASASVWKELQPVLQQQPPNKALTQDLLVIACRMALLLLEGIWTLSVGNPLGIPPTWTWQDDNGDTILLPALKVDTLVSWLSKRIDQITASDQQYSLKFALALYTARCDFLARQNGKLVDARIRSARKELKQAMEIFQHKLKPTESGSMASSSNDVSQAGNSTLASSVLTLQPQQQEQTQPQVLLLPSPLLQRQNQAALSLKANTEQLKGNIKKSLILCSEAQAAMPGAEDAIHFNNLAIVYATHGKPHLALHSWSKAVAKVTSSENNNNNVLEKDGTVRLDATCKILWNAALGSLQARNFMGAYECLGHCLEHSSIWRQRSRAWLRLGEAAVGIWSTMQKRRIESQQQEGVLVGGTAGGGGYSTIELGGQPKGILLEKTTGEPKEIDELAAVLASPEDLAQLQINPLPRARFSLAHAVELMDRHGESNQGILALASAQVSLAYVCLETKDFASAREYADAVLKHILPEAGMDSASKALFQRQQATARMYASEAACMLGDAVSSMKYLVGDGKNDAFDRLASALGGVTIETAATHTGSQGKMRLAKAQAMVRCSASAASACMGNLAAAKQLAMSAQAMSREGSYATRALVYCMLREGNRGAALTLLRSAR